MAKVLTINCCEILKYKACNQFILVYVQRNTFSASYQENKIGDQERSNMTVSASLRSNLCFRVKPKMSFFDNRQFGGHFLLNPKFSKKCKILWRKSFENVFNSQKNVFFSKRFGKFFSKKLS